MTVLKYKTPADEGVVGDFEWAKRFTRQGDRYCSKQKAKTADG